MSHELAPICLFVYNRPYHTRKTLEALAQNYLAQTSHLYVFCDGPKSDCSEENLDNIKKVREIVGEIKWCGKVTISESLFNIGLANSVISGISKVLSKHERVIVLEDDLLTGRYFLNYMNLALNKYEDSSHVKQISGYSFPLFNDEKKGDSYFLPITSTWGWATWSRVWDEIDFDCSGFDYKMKKRKVRYDFNFFGSYNFSKLLKMQMSNKNVSSWGIRFYYNVFNCNGIVLYPNNSLVKNIGWDSSGRHGATFDLYKHNNWDKNNSIEVYPQPLVNSSDLNLCIQYLRKENNFFKKFIRKAKSYLKSF